jgi:hypothetical protein
MYEVLSDSDRQFQRLNGEGASEVDMENEMGYAGHSIHGHVTEIVNYDTRFCIQPDIVSSVADRNFDKAWSSNGHGVVGEY